VQKKMNKDRNKQSTKRQQLQQEDSDDSSSGSEVDGRYGSKREQRFVEQLERNADRYVTEASRRPYQQHVEEAKASFQEFERRLILARGSILNCGTLKDGSSVVVGISAEYVEAQIHEFVDKGYDFETPKRWQEMHVLINTFLLDLVMHWHLFKYLNSGVQMQGWHSQWDGPDSVVPNPDGELKRFKLKSSYSIYAVQENIKIAKAALNHAMGDLQAYADDQNSFLSKQEINEEKKFLANELRAMRQLQLELDDREKIVFAHIVQIPVTIETFLERVVKKSLYDERGKACEDYTFVISKGDSNPLSSKNLPTSRREYAAETTKLFYSINTKRRYLVISFTPKPQYNPGQAVGLSKIRREAELITILAIDTAMH
jgi:hypothetical protein